jgi:hypothetical protein
LALILWLMDAETAIAARRTMIKITTSRSISVKPVSSLTRTYLPLTIDAPTRSV